MCILDAFFTDLGLRNSLIPMNWLYKNSIVGFYALKIIISLLLVAILCRIQPFFLRKF
ncbi:DUF5658 family protein [Rummeliibacillus pycnus]|uniref:DUF5658 family protein n=1 Tax=Rummeliibacillus pycnus TaxID=101070 RepID=UPI00389ADC58